MRPTQATASQQQDPESQLQSLLARSRELRLRLSDLQMREQQVRELRMQSLVTSPDRPSLDKQWMDVHHNVTAAQLELEALNDRISEARTQRDQTRREQAIRDQNQRDQALLTQPRPAGTLQPPQTGPDRPPVEVPSLANVAEMAMLIFFVAPLVLILVYRFLARGSTPRPSLGIEESPRFQRLEQTVETIAMEVERIAEGQRFTTAILAERHPGAAPHAQITPPQASDTIAPR